MPTFIVCNMVGIKMSINFNPSDNEEYLIGQGTDTKKADSLPINSAEDLSIFSDNPNMQNNTENSIFDLDSKESSDTSNLIDTTKQIVQDTNKNEVLSTSTNTAVESNPNKSCYNKFNISQMPEVESNETITLKSGESVAVSDYIELIPQQKVGFETDEEYQQYVIQALSENLESAKEILTRQEEDDGLISKAFNGIKEFLNIGVSKQDAEEALHEQEEILAGLNAAINGQSDMTFEEAYQFYIGSEFSKEKIDKYMEMSNIAAAVNSACSYDKDYAEKFKEATGKTVEEINEEFALCQTETLGKSEKLNDMVDKYSQSQEGFADKLSAAVSTAGLVCIVAGAVASFIPGGAAIGIPLMTAGKYVSLGGMLADNAIDLVDYATDKDGLSGQEISSLALETGVELVSYTAGQGIGRLTNGLNTFVASKAASSGLGKASSYILGQSAETVTDTALSLSADYAIVQGQSLISTGEFMKAEDYWSLERFTGEGRNQLIGIITGLSSTKVNSYSKDIVSSAQQKILDGDIEGAKTYLKKNGLGNYAKDNNFNKLVEQTRIGASQNQIINKAQKMISEGDAIGARQFLEESGFRVTDESFKAFSESLSAEQSKTRTINETNDVNFKGMFLQRIAPQDDISQKSTFSMVKEAVELSGASPELSDSQCAKITTEIDFATNMLNICGIKVTTEDIIQLAKNCDFSTSSIRNFASVTSIYGDFGKAIILSKLLDNGSIDSYTLKSISQDSSPSKSFDLAYKEHFEEVLAQAGFSKDAIAEFNELANNITNGKTEIPKTGEFVEKISSAKLKSNQEQQIEQNFESSNKKNQTQETDSCELTEIKDENGNKLFTSEDIEKINNLAQEYTGIQERVAELANLRKQDGTILFNNKDDIVTLARYNGEAYRRIVELANSKNHLGENIFKAADLFQLTISNDARYSKVLKLINLKNEKGENIFKTGPELIPLLRFNDEGFERAINLAAITDSSGEPVFKPYDLEYMKYELEKDETTYSRMLELAKLKNNQGKSLLPAYNIKELAILDDCTYSRIMGLINLKNKNGDTIFNAFDMKQIAQSNDTIYSRILELANLRSNQGDNIFTPEDILSIAVNEKDYQRTIRFAQLKDKNGDCLLSKNCFSTLLMWEPDTCDEIFELFKNTSIGSTITDISYYKLDNNTGNELKLVSEWVDQDTGTKISIVEKINGSGESVAERMETYPDGTVKSWKIGGTNSFETITLENSQNSDGVLKSQTEIIYDDKTKAPIAVLSTKKSETLDGVYEKTLYRLSDYDEDYDVIGGIQDGTIKGGEKLSEVITNPDGTCTYRENTLVNGSNIQRTYDKGANGIDYRYKYHITDETGVQILDTNISFVKNSNNQTTTTINDIEYVTTFDDNAKTLTIKSVQGEERIDFSKRLSDDTSWEAIKELPVNIIKNLQSTYWYRIDNEMESGVYTYSIPRKTSKNETVYDICGKTITQTYDEQQKKFVVSGNTLFGYFEGNATYNPDKKTLTFEDNGITIPVDGISVEELKQMPIAVVLNLADCGTDIKVIRDYMLNYKDNKGMFLLSTTSPFIVAHELGHIQDFCFLNLNSNPELIEIYNSEIKNYNNRYTNKAGQNAIKYFSQTGGSAGNGLSELIAETNALMSIYGQGDAITEQRAQFLAQNFPKTVAYIATKLGLNAV